MVLASLRADQAAANKYASIRRRQVGLGQWKDTTPNSHWPASIERKVCLSSKVPQAPSELLLVDEPSSGRKAYPGKRNPVGVAAEEAAMSYRQREVMPDERSRQEGQLLKDKLR